MVPHLLASVWLEKYTR